VRHPPPPHLVTFLGDVHFISMLEFTIACYRRIIECDKSPKSYEAFVYMFAHALVGEPEF
jgi:hypothetical protein